MSADLEAEYQQRFAKILQPTADALKELINSYLSDVVHIDRIGARAKAPERFVKKARKLDEQGKPKYSDPTVQIQDQIGARVIVFYLNDVLKISEILLSYLRPIEIKDLVPESEWEFGYVGKHSICALPGDVVPPEVKREDAPRFFELQVKTLFQHAWSEANHDLGYKPGGKTKPDQNRLLAYTAAQSWGADRVFQELMEGQ